MTDPAVLVQGIMYIPGLDQAAHRLWHNWVLKGRCREAERIAGSSTLVANHGWRLRCSYLLFFLLFGLMCAGALLVEGVFDDEPLWLTLLYRGCSVAAALLGAAMAVIAFRERVVIAEHGLVVVSGLRPALEACWHEIAKLETHPGGEALVLTTASGAKRRISMYLNGFATLERVVTDRCGS